MSSYGCPLCCDQKFDTILALREHLLYYIYRPLMCVLCSVTIGGICDLIHHLQTHLNLDKVPENLSKKGDGIQSSKNLNENVNYEYIKINNRTENTRYASEPTNPEFCSKKDFSQYKFHSESSNIWYVLKTDERKTVLNSQTYDGKRVNYSVHSGTKEETLNQTTSYPLVEQECDILSDVSETLSLSGKLYFIRLS